MHLVIDADSIVYTAAHVAEENFYTVLSADGALLARDVDYQTAKKAAENVAGAVTYKRTEVKDVSVAIQAARGAIRKTVDEVRARLGVAPQVTVLLNGYGNFRERMASVIRYKYNRVETQKPKHYGAVRKHLVDELGAELVHWYETDDRCAIMQSAAPDDVIVSSIDKDLLQVAGLHHIPGKGKAGAGAFMQVSEYSGALRFFIQALAGDSTDGIPGCKGTGPDGARKAMLAAADGATDMTDLGRRCWQAILGKYRAAAKKHDLPDPDATALETARLVYMLRAEPPEPHNPPLWEAPT